MGDKGRASSEYFSYRTVAVSGADLVLKEPENDLVDSLPSRS